MIIKTASDYKGFIEAMSTSHKLDNFMINFIHAYQRINVGCSCKRKNRIAAAEQKKLESILNMSKSFIDSAKDKFQEDIYFYNNNQEILFIENEPR